MRRLSHIPRVASRRHQRGAAAVFAAIGLISGLAAAALAIDMGRLYFAQRDLQRVANMAALDSARVAGGCMGVPENAEAAAYAETLGSIGRNSRNETQPDVAITPDRVEVGRRRTSADGNRYFETAPEDKNRAVRVYLQRAAPSRLMQFTGRAGGPETLTATAAAYSRPMASIEVGSRLAQISPDVLNNFLRQALGAPVNLDLVSYRNLLGADVPVADILEDAGVGSPDEILVVDVPTRDFLDAVVTAVGTTGNTVALAAARRIADAAVLPTDIAPGEVLALEDAAAGTLSGTLVNAGALMLAVAEAANGAALFDLPVALPPPLDSSSGRFRFIQPGNQANLSPGIPAAAGSDTYAANGQAILEADINLDLPLLGRVALPLFVEAAQATATVEEIRCARRGQASDSVLVRARSSISRIGVGRFDDINLPSPTPQAVTLVDVSNVPLLVAGITLPVKVRIDAFALVDIPSDDATLEFTAPFPGEAQSIGRPQAEVLASAISQIPSNLVLNIVIDAGNGTLPALGVLDAVLASTRQAIEVAFRSQLASGLAVFGDQLLAPTLANLGLSLGGADVSVRSVVTEEPELFTR